MKKERPLWTSFPPVRATLKALSSFGITSATWIPLCGRWPNIYDTDDLKRLYKEVMAELGMDQTQFDFWRDTLREELELSYL